jgi:hypothetical protein
MIKWISTVLK